ncbi:MAG: relaxase/mobilization nuclease domain-containing protein [bacterium]|nr:relaxase/mobilization nuclease domain-containing protein [bacterium]
MIVKSISHTSRNASVTNLIAYVFNDSDLANDKGETVTVTNLLRGGRDKWAEQFRRVEARRKRHYAGREVRLYHEILSWHKDSKPTKEHIEDLMYRYIQYRCQDKPVLAFGAVHFSHSHYHAHLIIQGVDAYGSSIRMSKYDFKHGVRIRMNEYERNQYPEVSKKSFIDYSQASKTPHKNHSHKSQQRYERTGERPKKERCFDQVQAAFIESDSIEAFVAELKMRNIDAYYRGGTLCGVVFEGTKMRLARSLGVDYMPLMKPEKKSLRRDHIRRLRSEKDNDKNIER